MYKPLLLSCLCIAPAARADVFSSMMASMNQHMRDMEEHMRHIESMMQTRQGLRSPSITFNVAEDKENVVIQFKGIKSDKELNAVMGDGGNHLHIQTPQGTINLRARDRFLTIEINHKEEQKQDDNGRASSAVSMSTSASSQLLSHKVSLDDVNLEYDQDAQILTLAIPKDLGKRVPITIKKK
jgi:HSP20 family molecular chaperone IbpA